ncbi:UNVERIFIED_CONTAM: hypothetical protein FKN15_018819 [Acipenser sinensis]
MTNGDPKHRQGDTLLNLLILSYLSSYHLSNQRREHSQEKLRHSEREWDEVIQVVIESLPERPQPPPESPAPMEGEYAVPPRREHPLLLAPEPQRESPASPECPALPPEKENPVPQLPPESSAPQLPSKRVCPALPGRECPALPKRKCPTLPVKGCRAAASERLQSNTSERVSPATWKKLSCATREREYLMPSEPHATRAPKNSFHCFKLHPVPSPFLSATD